MNYMLITFSYFLLAFCRNAIWILEISTAGWCKPLVRPFAQLQEKQVGHVQTVPKVYDGFASTKWLWLFRKVGVPRKNPNDLLWQDKPILWYILYIIIILCIIYIYIHVCMYWMGLAYLRTCPIWLILRVDEQVDSPNHQWFGCATIKAGLGPTAGWTLVERNILSSSLCDIL